MSAQVSSDAHLRIDSLSKHFGPLTAIDNVTLTIRRGSITGLIGPNGAGKSTLFDTLAGETQADSGTILFNNKPVQKQSANRRFRNGLARTFQIPQPFPEMTVLDNLMLAMPGQVGESVWTPVLRPGAIKRQEAHNLDRARQVLEFTTLEKVAMLAARNLSGGQQKLLELARVLMGEPELILLDEPAAGVNPTLTELLLDKIHALNNQGITFLIIEHNMDLVMRHCDPIVAMANGLVIFEGNAKQAMECDALLESYLGDSPSDSPSDSLGDSPGDSSHRNP